MGPSRQRFLPLSFFFLACPAMTPNQIPVFLGFRAQADSFAPISLRRPSPHPFSHPSDAGEALAAFEADLNLADELYTNAVVEIVTRGYSGEIEDLPSTATWLRSCHATPFALFYPIFFSNRRRTCAEPRRPLDHVADHHRAFPGPPKSP